MKVLIATSNQGKFHELQKGLAPLGWDLVSFDDFPVDLPPENGATFEENAIMKAAFSSSKTGLPCIADDSGLEVEALGGEPGIYSARFGGRKTDLERNVYLLERMRNTPVPKRGAKFVAVVVLAFPDGGIQSYRGESVGKILEAPVGDEGFGYDPLFFFPQAGKTFGQMSSEEKAGYSHRGKALDLLLKDHFQKDRDPIIAPSRRD